MDKLTELKKYIFSSSLSSEKQFAFILLVSSISEEKMDALLELFREDVEWVEKMYDNYTKKEEAFSDKNIGAMETILTEEKKTIEEYNN